MAALALAIARAIALILQAIGAVDSLHSFLVLISGGGQALATAKALQTVDNTIISINGDVENPVYGLQALAHLIAAARSDILAAVGTRQSSSLAVILPSPPPAGYGGASASDVWLEPIALAAGTPAGDVLAWSGIAAVNRGGAEDYLAMGIDVGWLVSGEWNNLQLSPDVTLGTIDPTTILVTDASPTAWADRVYPNFSPYSTDSQGRPFFRDQRPGAGWYYTIDMTWDRFREWKQLSLPPSPAAPVWPGLANVALGASLALANGLTVPGPLDGVIVHISSVAPPTGFYPFGATKSFVHVGAVVFFDDNGQGELAQPLGLEQDVICPRTMVVADHAVIRVTSGVVGTIRPWSHV